MDISPKRGSNSSRNLRYRFDTSVTGTAVLYAKENGKITNADYQRIADISAATARRDLKDLIDKNILEMKGERKGIYYILKSHL